MVTQTAGFRIFYFLLLAFVVSDSPPGRGFRLVLGLSHLRKPEQSSGVVVVDLLENLVRKKKKPDRNREGADAGSDDQHFDAVRVQLFDRLSWNARIGDHPVNAPDIADNRKAAASELAGVGDDRDLFGDPHH